MFQVDLDDPLEQSAQARRRTADLHEHPLLADSVSRLTFQQAALGLAIERHPMTTAPIFGRQGYGRCRAMATWRFAPFGGFSVWSIRSQSVLRFQRRRPPQSQGTSLSIQVWNGQVATAPHAGFVCACSSTSPWFARSSVFRSLRGQARAPRSTLRGSLAPSWPDVRPDELHRAWRNILIRVRPNQPHTISREQLSVREHMSIMLRELRGQRFVNSTIFSTSRAACQCWSSSS